MSQYYSPLAISPEGELVRLTTFNRIKLIHGVGSILTPIGEVTYFIWVNF